MRMIIAIVQPHRLDDVRDALAELTAEHERALEALNDERSRVA